jgi:CRP-like cAMP-binding protein
VLFTAAEGELFAEAALFSETYHCDAMAVTEATVRIYPRPILLSLLRRDPCPSRKSYPRVAMMQSEQNWCGNNRS